MNKEDQILSATLRDKLRQCENKNIMTHSGFLSPAEVNLAESFCIAQKARFALDGGYPDAERRVCIFLPDWLEWNMEPDSAEGTEEDAASDPNDPLAVLHVEVPKGSRELTHRDYMGSILGLGVQRSVVGDIIVGENCADIVILKDMAEFFEMNLTSVGRASASVTVCGRDALSEAEQKTEQIRDTVASARLDSICASAFRLARGKAQEAVKQGLVSINGRQCLKPDAELSEGDRISFRGKGKAILTEVGGRTRKDRITIIIERLK